MLRRFTIPLILILLVTFFIPSAARAAKSYYAERFDVQIDLQENGSAIITETVEFHFSGDPFTFAFREISAHQTDGLTFLDASMDGVPMPLGTQAGQVEVEAGDPLKVTWHFPPTSDTAHVFTVRYRADGVIRKDDADTLVWRAIPEEHEYSINRSTVVLTYPPQISLIEQPRLDWNHDAAFEDGRVVLTATGIGEDDDVILTARFPPNSLTQAPPQWQTRAEQSRAAMTGALPFGLLAGLATLVLGGFALFTFSRSNARDNVPTVTSATNPPSDLSPALVGKLTGQQHNFMGAIFDLAQRGLLEIREEEGSWGSKKHVLIRKDTSLSLKPHERGLLDVLFKEGESQIDMNEVATRLAMKNKLFDEPLEGELLQRGWLDLERQRKRTMLIAIGLTLLFFSLIVLILGLLSAAFNASENYDWLPWIVVLIGIAAGSFVLSIALFIYSASFSILTPVGEEQAARWKGFGRYLKDVSKGREAAVRPDLFEKYLAYAAVFGLGTVWAKYFQQLGGVPLPVWFHGMTGSNADFAAIVAVMSASDTSGAGAGGASGGGASGGGSSGAG